jgi:hypothetical protein
VRKLAAVATVAMTLTLLTRSPITAAATFTGTGYKDFATLARHGLTVPFTALYTVAPHSGFVPPWFEVWSEPTPPNLDAGDFVYQAPLGHGRFRFVRTHGTDFECVQATVKAKWSCVGPYVPDSIGQVMQVYSYRLPMWVGEQIVADGFGPKPKLLYRDVHGRRLWCSSFDDGAIWCLAPTGQFAYSAEPTGGGVGVRRIEAVALSLTYSKQILVLPAKARQLKKDGPPVICDGSPICPSPGPEP